MSQPPTIRSALRHLDPIAVSAASKVETRSREHHLPPISVYRWWARRTEAVNGALLDAVSKERDAPGSMFVVDPFVGGGVIPLAALRRSHRVYAQDLNPWVTQGLEAMLTLPEPEALEKALARLRLAASKLSRRAYATRFADGQPAAISQSIRVAVSRCSHCGHRHRMFPHALVSQMRRRETGLTESVLACQNGHLFTGSNDRISACPHCDSEVDPDAVYQPSRLVTCPRCAHRESLDARATPGPWDWELVLVERVAGLRRELGFPTAEEIEQASSDQWVPRRQLGRIPVSGETQVLLRHGFRSWSDLYPHRQRFVIERLLSLVPKVAHDVREARALTMAVLGSTEMAGHLSRWDRFYLKSYESMSSHRFNLTTLSVEPNVLGAESWGRGTTARRIRLFQRASRWLKSEGISVDLQVVTATAKAQRIDQGGVVTVALGSSETLALPDACVDLILTDPPYHDDVQYHELSLPLRAWAKLSRGRPTGEAVAIPHSSALSSHRAYRGVLERVFTELHRVLKPDGRLLFSYANRESVAWVNLFMALRASGFRPLGFSIVHSENESDNAKRTNRACTLDLIVELVRRDAVVDVQHRAQPVFHTEEEAYLLAVGEAFLRSGDIVEAWAPAMLKILNEQSFVQNLKPTATLIFPPGNDQSSSMRKTACS